MASATGVRERFRRVRAVWRHLARIRYRLLLINIAIAAVPIVGISFAHLHESQLLAGLEADMVHQAELLRTVIAANPLAVTDDVLAKSARDTRTRIRILDTAGRVVADSHRGGPPEGAERPVPHLLRGDSPTHAAEVPKPVELSTRSEVQAALAGRYGSATRLWEHQDRVYLFVALPVNIGGHVQGVVYVTRSTHEVKMQLYRLRAWLSKLLFATVIGAALLTLLFATTIVRPLARLTRGAERIAARQPDDETVKLAKRTDEIGQLSRAVAAMTDELERRARDARTLAADISHELKNPLASIRGAAELLRDGASDDPAARERFLAMILDDVARLDRLVSRLMELARVEDDRGTQVPVDLGAIARGLSARPWGTDVEVSCDDDAIVNGRAGALASAIENLVANAAQHADPGTPVGIRIARDSDRVRVTVINRGPALSPGAQRRVWDRFYTTRVEAGGSGIGLSIVRAVALAHGGSVNVRCDGGVTEFWFDVAA
jgi:two-component system sensor histidine kinase ChvG